jgi:hypothetical protein
MIITDVSNNVEIFSLLLIHYQKVIHPVKIGSLYVTVTYPSVSFAEPQSSMPCINPQAPTHIVADTHYHTHQGNNDSVINILISVHYSRHL